MPNCSSQHVLWVQKRQIPLQITKASTRCIELLTSCICIELFQYKLRNIGESNFGLAPSLPKVLVLNQRPPRLCRWLHPTGAGGLIYKELWGIWWKRSFSCCCFSYVCFTWAKLKCSRIKKPPQQRPLHSFGDLLMKKSSWTPTPSVCKTPIVIPRNKQLPTGSSAEQPWIAWFAPAESTLHPPSTDLSETFKATKQCFLFLYSKAWLVI